MGKPRSFWGGAIETQEPEILPFPRPCSGPLMVSACSLTPSLPHPARISLGPPLLQSHRGSRLPDSRNGPW